MSEKIVIIDKKRRRRRYIILLIPLLLFIFAIIAQIMQYEAVAVGLCIGSFGAILFSLYKSISTIWLADKIKYQNEYIYCKSPKFKSKYVSFWGNAKIPIPEVKSVHLRHILPPKQLLPRLWFYLSKKTTGSIDICGDTLIARIPCLGVFSSQKYIEDVQNYFMQRGIEVKTNAEESDNAYEDDEKQQIELIERQETISDTENMNDSADIAFINDADQTNVLRRDTNIRRRKIVNTADANSETKPSTKQNKPKGRQLEL